MRMSDLTNSRNDFKVQRAESPHPHPPTHSPTCKTQIKNAEGVGRKGVGGGRLRSRTLLLHLRRAESSSHRENMVISCHHRNRFPWEAPPVETTQPHSFYSWVSRSVWVSLGLGWEVAASEAPLQFSLQVCRLENKNNM